MDSQRFEQNLALLREVNPFFAENILRVSGNGSSFCCARNGELNLRLGDDYVHANYSPSKEAERWFSNLGIDQENVVFVYGVGLGYYYQAVKQWLHEQVDRYLIFLEDDLNVAYRFLETEQATEILNDPQVQVHYLGDDQRTEIVFVWLRWFFTFSAIEFSALDYYKRNRANRTDQLSARFLQGFINHNFVAREYAFGGKMFFENFYPNLLHLPGNYRGNKLFGQFKNVPAIICGAGPSLEKHLPLLKQLMNKALILSGGSGNNALINNGIQPHFTASLDPNIMQCVRQIDNHAYGMPVFYRNRLHHEAFQMIHGPKVFINGCNGYEVASWFEEQLGIGSTDDVQEGHNVINWLIELARLMGCNPIIMVGMDLAFTNMSWYASGVVNNPKAPEERILKGYAFDGKGFLRKDINGEPVYTLWKWTIESEWTGNYAKEYPQVTIINATEGGIGFPGVENVVLADVADQYLTREYDFANLISAGMQQTIIKELKVDDIKKTFNVMRDSFSKVSDLCDGMISELLSLVSAAQNGDDVPTSLETGQYTLFELDLVSELAYKQVMEIITSVYDKILERRYYETHRNKALTPQQKVIQLLGIKIDKIKYIKGVAKISITLIDGVIKKYKHQQELLYGEPKLVK